MQLSRTLEGVARNLITTYDLARLTRYQQNTEHFSDIEIKQLGHHGLAARFPEVGYFNQLHLPESEALPDWDEVNRFYGKGHTFYIRTTAGSDRSRQLTQLGGRRLTTYHTLVQELCLITEKNEHKPPIRFQKIGPVEAATFAGLYLELFKACPIRPLAARSNLALLPTIPDLHSYLIIEGSRPVGFELLYVSQEWALLAGGAILPEARHRGYHRASISHRIALAKQMGCRHVAAWTYARNASFNNLQAGGLTHALEDEVFQFKGK